MTYILGVLLIAVLLVIDQAIKQITVLGMNIGDSFVVIKNFFSITSVRNTGAAWNLFNNQLAFFVVITIIALGIFIYFFIKADHQKKPVYFFGVSLMIAGTLGNFIDRLFYPNHAVVDMFEFTFIDFPVFNFADACLVIGIILFAIDFLFLEKEKKENGK